MASEVFEIGDKVLTVTGLYIGGDWRERGLKGKIVDKSNEYGGLLTVKFKGIEELRFLRSEYLIIREKAKGTAEELIARESARPFQVGDSVVFTKAVVTGGLTVEVAKGIWAEVIELIPDSNLVVVEFDDYGTLTVVEEVLASEAETFGEEVPEEAEHIDSPFALGDTVYVKHDASVIGRDYINGGVSGTVTEVCGDDLVLVDFGQGVLHDVPVSDLSREPQKFEGRTVGDDSPEVLAALQLVLERIEEIKTLLTTKPQNEFVINVHPSNGLTEEEVAAVVQEEEPAPEPVFKKAKAVKVGDSLYTEGGAYDKVGRKEVKASGYTSLYGVWGNRIAQVPSGRVVQVLEEVS